VLLVLPAAVRPSLLPQTGRAAPAGGWPGRRPTAGRPRRARPITGRESNPSQKTRNAQNRHLIPSPGVAGPCGVRSAASRRRPRCAGLCWRGPSWCRHGERGWVRSVWLPSALLYSVITMFLFILWYFLILVLYLNMQYLSYCTVAVGDA